jgi:peroxiredoxin Q/BCP
MAKLKNGEQAPEFTLIDQNGDKVSLSSYRGRKLLIFFYPKANTPGCKNHALSLRDAGKEFASFGVSVVGISPDMPDKQKKFDGKNNLGYPLLSDGDHSVSEAYDVWKEKTMFGKKYMGIVRSSFLIDEKGAIIEAWYKISPKDNVPKALETLQKLSE